MSERDYEREIWDAMEVALAAGEISPADLNRDYRCAACGVAPVDPFLGEDTCVACGLARPTSPPT